MKISLSERQNHTGTLAKLSIILPVMLIVLVMLLVAATAIGAVNVRFADTFKIILKNWGFIAGAGIDRGSESIIFFVRFPRVIVAALVGAALAASGAVMQGMFRNPMAEPGVLGVSSGASLGAITAIALGFTARSLYFMPLFASCGAFFAVIVIYLLASRNNKVPALTLILSGIAVSTFLGAIASMILMSLNDYQVRAFMFWTVGSLMDRRWEHVRLIALPLIACIVILASFGRDLNMMLLGEEEAQSVGLNPGRTRKLLLLFTSITTALAVSVSGAISFVGLIVPHIMRLLFGPDHRVLIPVSALGGAIFLVLCDLISRVVVIPKEVGVGIVTSLLGAPYFLYLLVRIKKDGEAM